MRTSILIFLLFVSSSGFTQQWQRHHRNDLGLSYSLTSSDYATGARHFRINPYDNSLWMITQSTAQTISADGTTKFFRWTNTPTLVTPYRLISLEFLPNKVFVLDEYGSVYLYQNETFSNMYATSGVFSSLATDEDTLYILRENNPIVKWTSENLYYLFNPGTLSRIVVKNSQLWIADKFGFPAVFAYEDDGSYIWYDPSTSLLMDHGNYDYKFSPHHDTLYVAGNKGLSLLYNQVFFDSIAPDNTTNMPMGVIIDFEFDADDNIWALFGSNGQTPTSIAHYNQASKTWDAYYDATNSDLNFDTYCSIEMDTAGNLWMVNQHYIHVLGLGTVPGWVSVKQPSFKQTVSVYPNPVMDVFSIETDAVLSELYLTDQLGKRIKTLNPNDNEFSVAELPAGIYFVELINASNEKSTVKLIKY